MTKIKVSIVEDHAGTRVNLIKVLQGAPELNCLQGYPDGETALREIPGNIPDVVLMDIRLPGMTGIECVAKLKEKVPQVDVLMLTTYEESDLIFESLRAGATGYLLKNMPPAELINAVVQARTGGSPLSMRIARKIVGHFQQIKKPVSETEALTKRERSDVELEDDFGCKIHIAAEMQVSAVQRSEVDKVFDGQAIMGLFQARAQGKLNAMAQRDPQLMFLNSTPPAAANGIIRPAS